MSSYVVTGAARGLGFELVKQLSTPSDNVVFALVRSAKTAGKLEALTRPNVHIIEADITDVKALKHAAQKVAEITGGKLDILINNAAYVLNDRYKVPLDEYPEGQEALLEEDLRKFFDTNVIGVIHTINVFLPLVRAGSAKKIITISTGVADCDFTVQAGFTISAPYSVSKAAVNMVVAKYAAQYKKDGLIFLALSPGFVNTRESTTELSEEDIAAFLGMVASLRKVYPEFTGPITPEESVIAMRKVIKEITIEDTGAFISHKGNKEWL